MHPLRIDHASPLSSRHGEWWSRMVKAMVLGSGQDGGLPQLGAAGPADAAARRGELAERTASSLVVSLDSGSLLLDASPDLRRQDVRRAMAGLAPITEVALTHGHMGHYTGLVHFGREAANSGGLRVWLTGSMARFLHNHEPWRRLFDAGHLVASVLEPGESGVIDGHTIRFHSVEHRAEFTDTVGISVDDQLLYLPDIDGWDGFPDGEATIRAHQTALLDATFFDHDELPGRAIAEIPHPLVTDTIDRFDHLADRIVLTHLNHTNALCDPDSAASEFVRSTGFRIATDGMVVD